MLPQFNLENQNIKLKRKYEARFENWTARWNLDGNKISLATAASGSGTQTLLSSDYQLIMRHVYPQLRSDWIIITNQSQLLFFFLHHRLNSPGLQKVVFSIIDHTT